MANVRPIVVNKEMVVLGGNMRLKAMQEAGWSEVPVQVVDWSEEKQREFIIKDNVGFGEWDWDELANTWDAEELKDWGLELPIFQMSKDQQTTDSTEYDFQNFDNTGFTTIKIVLPDDQAQELIDRIDLMKGDKNTSEYIYEHFCN